MSVLLLRLAGPLQAWGTRSRFMRRHTAAAPSKSGIVGLLAAAQGRRRSDPIEDLCALRLGVRIDQPGTLMWDYHTVSRAGGRLPTASGKLLGPDESTKVTHRAYLQDAVFVAGLEGDQALLEGLHEALGHPRFPLYLGRRSCPPTPPLVLGVVEGDVLGALARLPWQAAPWCQRCWRQRHDADEVTLEVVVDDLDGEPYEADFPLSFDPRDRRFATRRVARQEVRVPVAVERSAEQDDEALGSTGVPGGHDPFGVL